MEQKEPATEAERTAELREIYRLSDLSDLRGREFLRLLHLAYNEGLLGELLREIGYHHPSRVPLVADIEITPQMQAAGAKVLDQWHHPLILERWATEVFQAMLDARALSLSDSICAEEGRAGEGKGKSSGSERARRGSRPRPIAVPKG